MTEPEANTEGAEAALPVLVVEDDPSYGELLKYQLGRENYQPTIAKSGEEAVSLLSEINPIVVLLDIMLPGKDGREVLNELHGAQPDVPVVMMTAAGSVELAVECMKAGAYDFLTKPFDFERLKSILRNAIKFRELNVRVKHLEGALTQSHGFDQIVAYASGMRKIVDQARRAAASDSDILILGESGSGKEVLARAIHYNSVRRKGPFVAINCGAIPEGLLESELFGHERGAFTGAMTRRIGCFEQADGGTLFLDEIGEMRADMQVRLLRALEEREVRRVGGDKMIKVNARVISATNQDIISQLNDQRFRTDLYYRLAILVLELPPLRDRKEDIGPLAQAFLREVNRDGLTPINGIAPEALDALLKHDWPGNVRELKNAIERALVFEDSSLITVSSLPPEIVRNVLGQEYVPKAKILETFVGKKRDMAADAQDGGQEETQVEEKQAQVDGIQEAPQDGPVRTVVSSSGRFYPMPPEQPKAPDEIRPMDEEEKNILMRALSITGGNISEAARRLGLHRSTLHRKMTRFGLATEEELMADP